MDIVEKVLQLLNSRDGERGTATQQSRRDESIEHNIVTSELTSEEQSKWIEVSKIIGHTIEFGKFTTDSKQRHIAKIFADEIAMAFQVGKYRPYAADVLPTPGVQQTTNTQDDTQRTSPARAAISKSQSIIGAVAGLIDNIGGMIGGIMPAIVASVAIIGGAAILTALVYKLPEIIGALTEGIPAFMKFIGFVYPLVKEFLLTMVPKLQEFLMSVLPVVGNLIKDVTPLISHIFTTIYTNLFGFIGKLVSEVGSIIKSMFDPVFNSINHIATLTGNIVSEVVDRVFETIDKLAPLVKDFYDNFLDKASVISLKLIGAFEKVVGFINDNLQPSLNVLKSVISTITGSAVEIADIFSGVLFQAFNTTEGIVRRMWDGFKHITIFFDKLLSIPGEKIRDVSSSLTGLATSLAKFAAVALGSAVAGASMSFVDFFSNSGPIDKIITLTAKGKDIQTSSEAIMELAKAVSQIFVVDIKNAEKFNQLFYNLSNIDPTQLALTGEAFGVLQQKIGYLSGYGDNLKLVSEGIQGIISSTAGLTIIDETLKGIFQGISKIDTTGIKTITFRADIAQINRTNDILTTQVSIQKKILEEIIRNGKSISEIGVKTQQGGSTIINEPGGGSVPSSQSPSPRQIFNNSAYSFGIK